MADLRSGTLVEHTTLGVGRIVAVEANAVHVFFPEADRRFAAKLRLPTARPLLRTEGIAPDSWLEGLSAFTLDPKLGRYALAASWITHDEALDRFRAVYPKAFADPAYAGRKDGRAARWRAAHDRWAELLGDGQGERLAADGDAAAIAKRLLDVERRVAPLHPPADVDAVKAALAGPGSRPFCAALVDLLSVPSPGRARFDKLFAAARALPVDPEQQWLVATLFPFVASPARHVLLRPRTSCEAALRLGSALGDAAAPSWSPYAALRAMSVRLLERLAPVGAKDFVDVEAFLHVAATTAKRRTARSRP